MHHVLFFSSGFAHQNLETLFELIIKKCEIVQLTLQLQLPTLCFVRAVNCIVFALCLHPYDFVFPLLRLSGGWVGLFARFAPRVVFVHGRCCGSWSGTSQSTDCI